MVCVNQKPGENDNDKKNEMCDVQNQIKLPKWKTKCEMKESEHKNEKQKKYNKGGGEDRTGKENSHN